MKIFSALSEPFPSPSKGYPFHFLLSLWERKQVRAGEGQDGGETHFMCYGCHLPSQLSSSWQAILFNSRVFRTVSLFLETAQIFTLPPRIRYRPRPRSPFGKMISSLLKDRGMKRRDHLPER